MQSVKTEIRVIKNYTYTYDYSSNTRIMQSVKTNIRVIKNYAGHMQSKCQNY